MELNKQVMIDSFRWISFSPERRGEQEFTYYSDLLENDLAELGENQGNYRRKFIQKVMHIFHRQCRCASSMITGPANFNVYKNQKNNRLRDSAQADFEHWRKKYFKAVNRVRTLSPEAEIDLTLKEIENLEAMKIIYQAADKLKVNDDKINYLIEHGFFTSDAEWCIKNNFKLARANLTTKIRERKHKLEVMKSRIERKETFEKTFFKGGFINIENDRVIIKHDNKPPKEICKILSDNGFRFSHTTKSWVRKHTANAIHKAMSITPLIEHDFNSNNLH